jgi:membrane protease subunit (stomatin/prohibitin family)
VTEQVRPAFGTLGLALASFVIENLSLPKELQKSLDQRISMNMVGDMGRYAQFSAAQALSTAAANPGGGAGAGVGLGAGHRNGPNPGELREDRRGHHGYQVLPGMRQAHSPPIQILFRMR